MVKLQPDARAERTLERKQQLLDAALELMGQRGFANTSVEDLARAAGLAKGTVYLYFPTKEALLEALLASQSLLPELESVAEGLTEETNVEDLIHLLIPTIWQALHQRKATLSLFLRESIGKEEYGKLFLEKLMPPEDVLAEHLRSKVSETLKKAGQSDQSERLSGLNLAIYLRCLVISMVGVYVEQELLGGKQLRPMPEDELLETLRHLFLRGIQLDEPTTTP